MICRLCLSNIAKESQVPLFNAVENDGEYNLVNIIDKHINIKITLDDIVSTAICLKCDKSLKELNAFRLYIEQQQQKLQQMPPQNLKHDPDIDSSIEAVGVSTEIKTETGAFDADVEIKCEPEEDSKFVITDLESSQYTDLATEFYQGYTGIKKYELFEIWLRESTKKTKYDAVFKHVLEKIGVNNICDDYNKYLQKEVYRFCNTLFARWNKGHRSIKRFQTKNSNWLSTDLHFKIRQMSTEASSSNVERPCVPFCYNPKQRMTVKTCQKCNMAICSEHQFVLCSKCIS